MSLAQANPLGVWQSRSTFVFALAASAVGLGNLWRFAYLTGEYGGGAFVITYLACLFLVAIPVLIAEVVIGTHGRGNPVAAVRHASDRSLRSRGWMILGMLSCVTAFLILSYYSVVAGWALAYANDMQAGVFDAASAVVVGERFEQFLRNTDELIYWHSGFLAICAGVSALGIRRGIGALVWLVVPAVIALLFVLANFALEAGNVPATKAFLFSTKSMDFTAESVLMALGHAFFTLGVGVGVGISFGAYAPDRIPVVRSVMVVAVFDTLVALLAGLAIFPVLFTTNMDPAMGPGLLFVSVPYAYGNILQGEVFGPLFFLLVVIAALGSVVALMEPVVGMFVQHVKLKRLTSVSVVALLAWLLGVAVILSMGDGWLAQWNLFGFLDQLTADILLPAVSLLTTIFVGWRMRREILQLELAREPALFFWLWRFLLRYIAPLAICVIVAAAFGFL